MNYGNFYPLNSRITPQESSWMKHDAGIAVTWTSEEDEFLVQSHNRFSTEPSFLRYLIIAAGLPNKTFRDVAVRSRWISENVKRRQEDHNGLGRARIDNTEHTGFSFHVASQLVEPPSQRDFVLELLIHIEQLYDHISAKLSSLLLIDNLISLSINKTREDLKAILSMYRTYQHQFSKISSRLLFIFDKIRKGMMTILSILDEIVMPPLPELSEELYHAMCPPSNPPLPELSEELYHAMCPPSNLPEF